MMSTGRFERRLPVLLENLAEPQTPDYYDDLFWQTAHTSQRSAWTIRERWLPMLRDRSTARRASDALARHRPPLLLIGALAAGLVLAGARQKPPPLTGPAGNGLVALSRDGDILTFDPRTGVASVVIGPDPRSTMIRSGHRMGRASSSVAKHRTCPERTS